MHSLLTILLAVAVVYSDTSSTAHAVTFSELLTGKGESGCCRDSNGRSGDESNAHVVTSATECTDLCAADTSCVGCEYQTWGSNICELHVDVALVRKGGCQCFLKNTDGSTQEASTPTEVSSTAEDTTLEASTAEDTTLEASTAEDTTLEASTAEDTTLEASTAEDTTVVADTTVEAEDTTVVADTTVEAEDTTVVAHTTVVAEDTTEVAESPHPIGSGYEEVTNPSRGCCRTEENGAGSEVLPVELGETTTTCEAKCDNRGDCTGYEFHTWSQGCELHTGAGDFYKTSGYEQCICVRKISTGQVTTEPAAVTTEPAAVTTEPAAVTTEPAAVTTEPAAVTTVLEEDTTGGGVFFVEITNTARGCCRTEDWGPGEEVTPLLTDHTLQSCQDECVIRPECTGVEYHEWASTCELHTGVGDFFQTLPKSDCICMQKVGGDTGVTQPTSGPETTADAGGGGTSSGTSTEHLVAQNCLAVAEVESVAPTGSWVFEQDFNDYAGTGYYTWRGSNFFHTRFAGVHGLLTYKLRILEAGTYQVRVRNYHTYPDRTEENDCWIRVGTSGWNKIFSNDVNRWTWQTKFDLHLWEANPAASYDLVPGVYDLELSGRSHGFSIDRIHVFKESCSSKSDRENPHFLPTTGGFPGTLVTAAATTTFAPGSGYSELSPRGCCRTASGGGGQPFLVEQKETQAECETRCNGHSACQGYEYHVGTKNCELHPLESFFRAEPNDDCRCVQRIGGDLDFEAASDEPATDAPEDTTTTFGTGSGYSELSPQGCCRTESGSGGDPFLVEQMDTQAECESRCDEHATCSGYEYHYGTNNCELHPLESFHHSEAHPECRCVQRVTGDVEFVSASDAPPPDTTKAPLEISTTSDAAAEGGDTGIYTEIVPQGCCRTADMQSGDERAVVIVASRDACAVLCTADTTCTGYEWHMWDNGCELHGGVGDFARTLEHAQCQCMQKTSGDSDIQPGRIRKSTTPGGQEPFLGDGSGGFSMSGHLAVIVGVGTAFLALIAVVVTRKHNRTTKNRLAHRNMSAEVELDWDASI